MKYSLLLLPLLLATQPLQGECQNLFQRMAKFGGGKKGKGDSLLEDVPTATLSTGLQIPLVGLGVGNMIAEVVPAIISHALRSDKKIRLIDTSSVSNNEQRVAEGIVEGAEYLAKSGEEKVEVHVITKVWYTHLGFERTMLAVKASTDALKSALEHPNVDLKLHVMIHWPRCYDNIPWMDCQREEDDLPEEVKQLGPPPHMDRVNAWKGSWKALETLFNDEESPVASIGVSNFHVRELEALTQMATVQPHIVETNMWSLLYDPMLVDYCHRNNIHMTAFQLIDGVLRKPAETPFAYHHLLVVANELTKTMRANDLLTADEELSAAQVVLAWLVQHSISVIPRTTDLSHLKENSAVALGKIPSMTDKQIQIAAHSVEALISKDDVPEDAGVKVTFHAKTKDVYLWWRDDEDEAEVEVAVLKKGQSFEEETHPGHSFRIYDSPEKSNFEVFNVDDVDGKYGDHHHVEL
jgi:diketogulonate reductase-like aldo/keto reductase